jgi:hypothetical protein
VARTYSISLNKREYQQYTEKKDSEQNYIIEQAKLKDRTTKTNINAAIQSNDFFKALVLLQDLNFEDGDLLSKINAGWLIEKTKLNDVYSTYLSQFNEYKREFETSESAFYLKHEDLIETEEITINGEEAYLQRISKTVDPKTKEYRKKKFEDDSYLYIKKGDKHLLCPVGVIGNYFTSRYNYMNVSDIEISLKFDTLTKSHFSTIDFKKNEKYVAFGGPILNTNTYKVKCFILPLPNEIQDLYNKGPKETVDSLLEIYFPLKKIYINSKENISIENLIKQDIDGEELRRVQSSFNQTIGLNDDIKKNIKNKIYLYTTNFYNPSLLYLIKKSYPNADSIVLLIGNYGEKLGKLGLHFSSNAGTKSEYYYASIIPLTKNVLELKNDKLIVYTKNGKYEEIQTGLIIKESMLDLSKIVADSLQLDSSFIKAQSSQSYTYTSDLIYQYPFDYAQFRIGYLNDGTVEYSNSDFYANQNVVINCLPVYDAGDIYFKEENQRYKPDQVFYPKSKINFELNRNPTFYSGESFNIKQAYSPYLKTYLNAYTNYLLYKEQNKTKKSTKSLNKANTALEKFKQIYFNPEYN